jgi:hypothetical protein
MISISNEQNRTPLKKPNLWCEDLENKLWNKIKYTTYGLGLAKKKYKSSQLELKIRISNLFYESHSSDYSYDWYDCPFDSYNESITNFKSYFRHKELFTYKDYRVLKYDIELKNNSFWKNLGQFDKEFGLTYSPITRRFELDSNNFIYIELRLKKKNSEWLVLATKERTIRDLNNLHMVNNLRDLHTVNNYPICLLYSNKRLSLFIFRLFSEANSLVGLRRKIQEIKSFQNEWIYIKLYFKLSYQLPEILVNNILEYLDYGNGSNKIKIEKNFI